MNSWKKTVNDLTAEFLAWGCPFSKRQLPEIAMAYDCTPLFFWNWQDGETEKTEKGFVTDFMVLKLKNAVIQKRYQSQWGREMPEGMLGE